MTCEHAHTTTVAWIYGEADDAHGLHVSQCEACQRVLDEHEGLLASVGPVAHRLDDANLYTAPRAANHPAGWMRWLGGGGALLLAAAALVLVLPGVQPARVGDTAMLDSDGQADAAGYGEAERLDDTIDLLEDDLDLFEDDLGTL